jgi:uncharacterized membrane protein
MHDVRATDTAGARRARLCSLVLLAALAAVALLAALQSQSSAVTSGLLVLLLVVPLAVAVPGLLACNRRTFAWATLCITPHFIYALTEIVANPSIRVRAAAMLVLSLALVVALVAYLRLTRTEDR